MLITPVTGLILLHFCLVKKNESSYFVVSKYFLRVFCTLVRDYPNKEALAVWTHYKFCQWTEPWHDPVCCCNTQYIKEICPLLQEFGGVQLDALATHGHKWWRPTCTNWISKCTHEPRTLTAGNVLWKQQCCLANLPIRPMWSWVWLVESSLCLLNFWVH